MKKKFIIWIVISLIMTAFNFFLTGIYNENDPNIFLGELLVPVFFTLIIPLLVGLSIGGISYLFTENFSTVFSKTVWTVQVISIVFLLLGYYGQLRQII